MNRNHFNTVTTLLTLFLLMIGTPEYLLVQEHTITIKNIIINETDTLNSEDYKYIILTDKDVITFNYELLATEKVVTPFMYNVELITKDGSSPKTSGFTNAMYGPLNEGMYTLNIYAFDLDSKWKTAIKIVKFKVNNSEATLFRKLKTLEAEKKIADSVIASMSKETNLKQNWDNISIYLIIAMSIVALIFIILFVIIRRKYKNVNATIGIVKQTTEKNLTRITELEKEIKEDSKQIEIDTLKSTIEKIVKKIGYINELEGIEQIVNNGVETVNNIDEQLTTLQRNKNEIFNDIVKGITDPTNVIKSLVDLLRKYDFNAIEIRDVVNNIIETASQVIDTMEDIQRLVEFESGTASLNLDTINPSTIVKEAIDKNATFAKDKEIVIRTDCPLNIQPIRLDASKITAVLHNLINNGIKFNKNGGKVIIKLAEKDDKLQFEISDTGIGIDKDRLDEIYKNLATTDGTTSNNTTIGLRTVKRYVELHGGRVTVSSITGHGTSFTFWIPYNL